MEGQTTTILVVALVVLAGLIAGWLLMQRRRTDHLRNQFGEEYDRVVETHGNARKAEADLEAREKRVAEFNIRPLTPAEHDRFAGQWHDAKALFVNDPTAAVDKSDDLITEVMKTRGYPVTDFEHRHADLTVEHGDVAKHYLAGHELSERAEAGEASTEDLRLAMTHFENLFDRLVDDVAAEHLDAKVVEDA
ncbi:hypothetical protein [Qipengyuania soli]|uniref:Secreted protein n=1 Tax=Qipengyuania soli TaxID=2782568 RepID=A0A7S8IUS9_9SPHN|nr:hypothetical protein [Qipengyuania soli]QPC98972.1 hypothetical protein IRL76_14270 [Qipengyuania soli]